VTAKQNAAAAGVARQYSGALGGIGRYQAAVHLTYASRPGQALAGRALYLTRDWAADDERRELTGSRTDWRSRAGQLCVVVNDSVAAPRQPLEWLFRTEWGARRMGPG
jgi:DDE superfamily endonuclease